MRITCSCGKEFVVEYRSQEETVRCPACKKPQSVPRNSEAISASAPGTPAGKLSKKRRPDEDRDDANTGSGSRSLIFLMLFGSAGIVIAFAIGCAALVYFVFLNQEPANQAANPVQEVRDKAKTPKEQPE